MIEPDRPLSAAEPARDQAAHTAATAAAYDALAPIWTADTADNLWNEVLERPGVRALLPADLHGRAVLDAGCAAGAHAVELLARGARVTGIDVSAEMVAEARRRCADAGGHAEFVVADLGAPLPLPEAAYDGVLCSLVLHYLRDWSVPLAEFARVLRPGGWLVLSSDHPATWWKGSPRPDYFTTELLTDTWVKERVTVQQQFWRRPLHAVVDALAGAGFLLERVVEPTLDDGARARFPDLVGPVVGRPWFIVYRAVLDPRR